MPNQKVTACGQELQFPAGTPPEDVAATIKSICPPGSDEAPEAPPQETPRPGFGLESADAIKPAPRERSLAEWLRDVWSRASAPNPGFRAATGRTPAEIEEVATALSSTTGERPDRVQHRLVSKLAADRFGTAAPIAAGVGWEVLGGLQSKIAGKDFANQETGFDPEDLKAGVQGAFNSGVPENLDELFAAVENDEDILPLLLEAAKRKKAAKR